MEYFPNRLVLWNSVAYSSMDRLFLMVPNQSKYLKKFFWQPTARSVAEIIESIPDLPCQPEIQSMEGCRKWDFMGIAKDPPCLIGPSG